MSNNSKILEAALGEYLDECTEMLERFSRGLSMIEKSQENADTYASIYRDMHTIKGNSQLFGYAQIGELAHAMETCLDQTRKGRLKVTAALADILYLGIDVISSLLQGIRHDKKEPDKRSELVKIIPRLLDLAESAVIGRDLGVKDNLPPNGHEDFADVSEVLRKREGLLIVRDTATNPKLEAMVSENNQEPPVDQGWGIFEDTPTTVVVPPERVLMTPPETSPAIQPLSNKLDDSQAKSTHEDNHSETIRVHVTLLDSLMNLVGELVLIRNQLLQHARMNDDDSDFSQISQRLNVLTAELQNEVMKTRMQPIGNILTKFKRVVRDVGKDLGKNIDLELQGAETELDKTIIEAVKDPLTHIVRNAVDHGIESASDRLKAGKQSTGHIIIRSYHESGQVIIEISDDGQGLDRKRIGTRAVERGLITQESFTKMTDRDVQFLIFAPGFSTAAAVSNISGRGVGMDVVKTNVERIGGVVDLISQVGKGTTIKLKIPLTLAIVPALIVNSRGQRFAIPQTKLVELLRVETSTSGGGKIEMLQGKPVFRLRGRLLPLLSLSEILYGTAMSVDAKSQISAVTAIADDVMNIAVLNADGVQFGLQVDEIEDSADIVVKSLSSFLKDITVFSGASVMGDGAVALTIDVLGIANKASIINSSNMDQQNAYSASANKLLLHESDVCEYLLVDVGCPGNYGIPLIIVSRLEEFDRDRIELSGEQAVVRYRNSLLPLYSLPEFLGLPVAANNVDKEERVRVVVIRRGERQFGIEVAEILDVISVDSKIDQSIRDRSGILGTLIHQDRVIVIADILGMIDELRRKTDVKSGVNGEGNVGRVSEKEKYVAAMRKQHRILLVEDSSFFRNHIKQVLQESGYQCDSACDGAEGMIHLDKHPASYFSLVLSDIEMPVLDGLGFVRKIRASKNWSKIPVVAITTRFSAADVERGKEAGFTGYLEKLNAEQLVSELDAVIFQQQTSQEIKHGTAN